MASKFLVAVFRPWVVIPQLKNVASRTLFPQTMTIRAAGSLIPPSQYDVPFPRKMSFPRVLAKNWELIPLFFITFTSMGLLAAAVVWSIGHKVDVLFNHKANRNISRTMDLMCPTVHKVVTINQKYEPWEEMALVLSKMRNANCKKVHANKAK